MTEHPKRVLQLIVQKYATIVWLLHIFYIRCAYYVKNLQNRKVFRLNILIFATAKNKYTTMKIKNSRLDAIRLILSTQEIGSQEELLNELEKEGF
mgnify:FL=1